MFGSSFHTIKPAMENVVPNSSHRIRANEVAQDDEEKYFKTTDVHCNTDRADNLQKLTTVDG